MNVRQFTYEERVWHYEVHGNEGAEPIVFIPGLSDSMLGQPAKAALAEEWYGPLVLRLMGDDLHDCLKSEYSCYVVSRPRGLANNESIASLARGYNAFIKQVLSKKVNVVGISMGGFITQQLCHDYPESVERAAIVVSGEHLTPAAPRLVGRWREPAAAHKWQDLLHCIAEDTIERKTVELGLKAAAYGLASGLKSWQASHSEVFDAEDPVRSIDACINFRSPLTKKPKVPILFFVAEHDKLFPPSEVRAFALALGIASKVITLNGVGHAYVEDDRMVEWCAQLIDNFFS